MSHKDGHRECGVIYFYYINIIESGEVMSQTHVCFVTRQVDKTQTRFFSLSWTTTDFSVHRTDF